ncbi:hypothetical protein Cgig2_032232 [Carnegiea gigantea]|uniref:NADH dehydrogenase subunit 2 n=1 Tax=Carnegiea gigantea TaxID=171969 RepID=A0A9Q1JHG6_9CARY|nr:hypothetical protein Cgig2_032232 [Carnegiea gigantea]
MIHQKKETNPLPVLRQAIRRVTPYIGVKVRRVKGSTRTSLAIRKRNLMEIPWNKNKNFILDSTRIFMKAFHLLLFNGSFIFPECILIFGLILLLKIDSTSDQKDIPWLYFISSTSLVMSITALLFRWRKEPMISFLGNFQMNNFNEIFPFLILLCSTLCIPLSVEYIECTEMALAEFLLFVLTTTLGGMFLYDTNDLITIFVSLECFNLCSYLLSGYTKKDVRSNEATTKYLLMGEASSSILVHGFSWLYGSSGGEIELQEIVNGLINIQMYNFPGISIVLIFITTPYIYEGVRFAREIPTSPSIFEIFGFFKTLWTCRREMLFPLRPRHNFYFMILGNLIAITQKSMKRMLAYLSIGQIRYVIIGIIVADSNDGYASMITYMLFYISMHLGTFACIRLFGLRTGTDNIRDYAGLYTKDLFLALSLDPCILSLGRLPPLARLLTSVLSIYYYLKIIKSLMTGRNREITPHVRHYRKYPLRSKNSIEFSMILCVIASTIPGISMNPIITIAQDTLF